MNKVSDLHILVFNSLDEQIAVIDKEGFVVEFNAAWKAFGVENGLAEEFQSTGTNYLNVLVASEDDDNSFASRIKEGILEVVGGKRDDFYCEYPCHSPSRKRWFMMRVTPLKDSAGRFFVVAHQDITRRRLAEEDAERAAMHDPLTELANRRYFNQFLRREIQRSIRDRSSISLIELDIDHFKHYNDELGHLAGDACLIQVGRVLLELSQRPTDLAVRLGGDEFALVLGNTNVAGAHKVSETLVAAIKELGISSAKSGNLSISVGVASVHPHEHEDEGILLKKADKALYEAKKSGRNKIMFSEPAD